MNRLNGFIDCFVDQTGYRQHKGIWSGVSFSDTILQSSGTISVSGYRNFEVTVQGGSGVLAWRQGKNQGWAVRNINAGGGAVGGPDSDGFFPLAVSGIFDFNDCYRTNKSLLLTSTVNGSLEITTDNRKLMLIGGNRAPLTMSGTLFVPLSATSASQDPGDMVFCQHSVVLPGIGPAPTFPTTSAEAQARALGIGTLTLNTGSGIVNVSVGSGIGQFVATTNTFLYVNTSTYNRVTFTQSIADLNYAIDTGPTGVRIFSPGLYKATYQLSIEKTVSTTIRDITARAVLFPAVSSALVQDQSKVLAGSNIYAAVTNLTGHSYATMNGQIYFNADAGDFFGIEAAYAQQTGTGQTTQINTSGTLLVIEKIGSKRGKF